MGNDEAAVPSTTLSPPPIAPVISVPTIPTPKPSMKRPTATASSPSQSSTADTSSVARAYNTHKLGLRIGGDAVAAGAAGVLVAPIITVIDRGIIENASGRRKLGGSVRTSLGEMVETRGAWFLRRPFGLVFVRLIYFVHSNTTFTFPQCIVRHVLAPNSPT